jgi:RNA polymerase sigma factor (sigma-70 family)
MTEDEQLLRCYAESRAEEAFSQLVSRHIDLVYSVALRLVGGDTHLAKDVVQTVFIDLSVKAKSLHRRVVLAGWLCRHAFFVASSKVRTEQRRRKRERDAVQMNVSDGLIEPDWEQLSAVLDEALQGLAPTDRDAIVLRYFEGRDLKSVGAALGMKEDTAQKRVSRALEKLRSALSKRGAVLTAAGLGTAMTGHAVTAAPVGMAANVAAATFAGIGSGSGSAVAWIKLLVALKSKMMIVSAAAVVMTGITASWLLQNDPVRTTRVQRSENDQKPIGVSRIEPNPVSVRKGRFGLHWSQVESTDYPRYIANLRALGCPEQTIRDIIIADLNQVYGSRAEAIRSLRRNEYWKQHRVAGPSPEQVKQLKELDREKMRVVKDLLGITIDPQDMVDLVYTQLPSSGRSVWFLPEERRQAVNDALREGGFDERIAEKPNSDGREFFDEEIKALADVLTTHELEQFRLHNSPRAQWLRGDVQYVNCTPEEFKALLDLREESLGPDAKDHLSVSRQTEIEQGRAVLGEERGKEYERLTDYGYLNGRRAAERAGLPDDLADRVGQIVYEARIAIEQLGKDSSLPVDERKDRAQNLKLLAESQLTAGLGGQPGPAVLSAMRGTLDNTAQMIRP